MKRSFTLRHIIVLKVIVAVGIFAQHYLPPGQAVAVAIGSNLLWLVLL